MFNKGLTTRSSSLLLWSLATLSWITFIQIPIHSDDMGMMLVARSFSNIKQFYYSHYGHQFGVNFPLAFLNTTVGHGLISYYMFAYLNFLSFIFSICALTEISFSDKRIALIAPMLIAASFTANETASAVMSDIPATAFLTWSLVLFHKALLIDGKLRYRMLFFAALCGFAGYGCKMTSVVFMLSIPTYEWIKRRSLRLSIYVGFAFWCLVGLELFYNWIVYKNPFIRFSITAALIRSQMNLPTIPSLSNYIFRVPLLFWTYFDARVLAILGLFGVVAGAFRRSPLLSSFAIGALAVFCMYAYPVVSWTPLVAAVNAMLRHYLLCLALFAVLSAFALVHSADALSRRFGFATALPWAASMIVLALLYQYQYQTTAGLLIRGASNPYMQASRDFKPFLAAHPELAATPTYTLPERNFGPYPGFNQLHMVDAERFPHPPTPFNVLARQRDLDYYTDQFAATGQPERSEEFSRLSRNTPHRRVLFEQSGVSFAMLDKAIQEKQAVFKWPPAKPDNRTVSWPEGAGKVKVLAHGTEFRSCEGCPPPYIQLCPPIPAQGEGTYQVELNARAGKGAAIQLEFLEQKTGRPAVRREARFTAFDFERGNTPSEDHIHRFREFRTTSDTAQICIGLRAIEGTHFVLESLDVYKFKE